jgi:hypothetical protein
LLQAKEPLPAPIFAVMVDMGRLVLSVEQLLSVEVCALIAVKKAIASMCNRLQSLTMGMLVPLATKSVAA